MERRTIPASRPYSRRTDGDGGRHVTSVRASALDRAGGQAGDDLAVEEMYMISGGMVISRMSMNSRFHMRGELALEVVERQLHGGVGVAGQEVERVLEVVEDDDRLDHDRR